MTRALCRRLDAERARDEKRERGFETRAAKKPNDDKITVQAMNNATLAYGKLSRSMAICRAVVRGEGIAVTVEGVAIDRWGNEFRALRNACLRATLENVNYWYSLASQRVQIDHMERDVQELRLAVSEALEGNP